MRWLFFSKTKKKKKKKKKTDTAWSNKLSVAQLTPASSLMSGLTDEEKSWRDTWMPSMPERYVDAAIERLIQLSTVLDKSRCLLSRSRSLYLSTDSPIPKPYSATSHRDARLSSFCICQFSFEIRRSAQRASGAFRIQPTPCTIDSSRSIESIKFIPLISVGLLLWYHLVGIGILDMLLVCFTSLAAWYCWSGHRPLSLASSAPLRTRNP